jgi:hypothetical protein
MIMSWRRVVPVLLLAAFFVATCAISLAQAQAVTYDGCQAAQTRAHATSMSLADVAAVGVPPEHAVSIKPSLVVFGSLPQSPVIAARAVLIEPLAPRAPPA